MLRRLVVVLGGLALGAWVAGCCDDVKHYFFPVLAGTYDAATVPMPPVCVGVGPAIGTGRVLVISDDRTRVTDTFTRDGSSYQVDYDVVRIDRIEAARQND